MGRKEETYNNLPPTRRQDLRHYYKDPQSYRSCARDPSPFGYAAIFAIGIQTRAMPRPARKRLHLRDLDGSPWDALQRRRSVYLDLSDPRWDALLEYHRAVAPNAPVQETIANLLLQAISGDQEREAIRQAGLKAFSEVRSHLWREISQAIKNVGASLELVPVSGESRGPAFGNFIVTEEETEKNGSSRSGSSGSDPGSEGN